MDKMFISNVEDNEILFNKKTETEYMRPSNVACASGSISDDTAGVSSVQSPIIGANNEQ